MAAGRVNSVSASTDQREAVLERLREDGAVSDEAIAHAQLVASRTGQPVEQVLNQLGGLSDEDLASVYAAVTGCNIWDPSRTPVAIGPHALGVSAEYLRRSRLLPVSEWQGGLVCAACDPLDDEAISGLVFATGRKVTILVARPGDWRRAFDQVFASEPDELASLDERRLEREIDQVSDLAAEGFGARIVAQVFEAAIAAGASDIHFEPRRHDLRIRLRIDGRLIDYQAVSISLAAPAVSRVKVIANLNLGERRLPQDGRTTFIIGGRQVDVRVATSPTVFGEAAVLRILDRSSVPLDLDALGLSPHVADVMRSAARSPHGIFLITGPTGSGKTTTLYALLRTFADSVKKVLSVEDPVEYHFDHVSQTQVSLQVGLTFASALRSFLRQDPDVILVGEIRDPETASVAVQAAMTGHLVLASVHANSALAVLPRLMDMGVEPYQLAAGFRGAAAQRLVRKLCPDCRRPATPGEAAIVFAKAVGGAAPSRAFVAAGCQVCKGSGFKGRIAIGEAFIADETLLRAIAECAPVAQLAILAGQNGLGSMALDGLAKAETGLTTFEEVAAAVYG